MSDGWSAHHTGRDETGQWVVESRFDPTAIDSMNKRRFDIAPVGKHGKVHEYPSTLCV